MSRYEDLPHDAYMEAVDAAFKAVGVEPKTYWTETPDGEQLDAVFQFHSLHIDAAEWPDGAYLGWDQNHGWLLIEPGGGRNVFDTELSIYANPTAVAAVVRALLVGKEEAEVHETWDGQDELIAAVHRWEDEAAGGDDQ